MQWEEMPMASSIIVVLHMRWVGFITFLIAMQCTGLWWMHGVVNMYD